MFFVCYDYPLSALSPYKLAKDETRRAVRVPGVTVKPGGDVEQS
jgi:hypothetical protein